MTTINSNSAISKSLQWFVWAVLAGALLLRLVLLSHSPLAPDEATRALAALDVVQGAGWAQSSDSPLLLLGNVLLFALFDAGNGWARLLPALGGAALVAVPWLWRKHLGMLGVGVAMLALACSPLSMFAARRVDGTALGVLGAALVLSLLFAEPAVSTGRRAVWLFALGLTVGLMGGASFFDVLLPGLLAWWLSRRLLSQPAGEMLRAWKLPALWGLGGAGLVALGFGLRLNGWGALGATFAAWLATWHGARHVSGAALLWLYEPLALSLAGVALGLSILRRDAVMLALSVWVATALVLLGLRPGVSPTLWSAVVLPLALLAGWAVQTLMADVTAKVSPWIWRHGAVGCVLWLPVGLALAGYANNTILVQRPIMLVLGVVVWLALHTLVALLFAYVIPAKFVWRGVLLGTAMALLWVQFSFLWGGAYARPTSTAELALTTAASDDLHALVHTLDEVAAREQKRRDTLSIALVAGDADFAATLRWVLRDFALVTTIAGWPREPYNVVLSSEAVTAPMGDVPSHLRMVHYVGMRFVALEHSDKRVPTCQTLMPLVCTDWAQWYVFREVPAGWRTQEAVLLWKAQ